LFPPDAVDPEVPPEDDDPALPGGPPPFESGPDWFELQATKKAAAKVMGKSR
jgi:hypothetical protein